MSREYACTHYLYRIVDVCSLSIQAYVSTLVSKLDHGGGSRWSLRVKLNDGSAVMDCDLANEVNMI